MALAARRRDRLEPGFRHTRTLKIKIYYVIAGCPRPATGQRERSGLGDPSNGEFVRLAAYVAGERT